MNSGGVAKFWLPGDDDRRMRRRAESDPRSDAKKKKSRNQTQADTSNEHLIPSDDQQLATRKPLTNENNKMQQLTSNGQEMPDRVDPLGPHTQLSTEQLQHIIGTTQSTSMRTNNTTHTPTTQSTFTLTNNSTHTPTTQQTHTNTALQRITQRQTMPNTYNTHDRAPFYVVMQKENINEILVSKLLMSSNVTGIVEIRKLAPSKIRVQCKNKESANQIICSDVINIQHNYRSFIPNNCIKSIGIIRNVPTELTDNEIEEFMVSEVPVESFERMNFWDQNEKRAKPGTSIKITFRATNIPTEIKLFYVVKRVEYFIPRPVLCNKCLRYGHIAKWCKSRETLCFNCSANTHAMGDTSCNRSCEHCTKSCTPKCKHCTQNTDHRTNSNTCPSMQTQLKIKEIMVKTKSTYAEAKISVNSVSDQTTTYANVTRISEVNKELIGRLRDAENLLKALLNIAQASPTPSQSSQADPPQPQHTAAPPSSLTDTLQIKEKIHSHFVKYKVTTQVQKPVDKGQQHITHNSTSFK